MMDMLLYDWGSPFMDQAVTEPTIHYPSASASWELGLQTCATINYERYFKNKRFFNLINQHKCLRNLTIIKTWVLLVDNHLEIYIQNLKYQNRTIGVNVSKKFVSE